MPFGVKISALPSAGSLQETDLFTTVSSGSNYQATIGQLGSLFLPLSGGTMSGYLTTAGLYYNDGEVLLGTSGSLYYETGSKMTSPTGSIYWANGSVLASYDGTLGTYAGRPLVNAAGDLLHDTGQVFNGIDGYIYHRYGSPVVHPDATIQFNSYCMDSAGSTGGPGQYLDTGSGFVVFDYLKYANGSPLTDTDSNLYYPTGDVLSDNTGQLLYVTGDTLTTVDGFLNLPSDLLDNSASSGSNGMVLEKMSGATNWTYPKWANGVEAMSSDSKLYDAGTNLVMDENGALYYTTTNVWTARDGTVYADGGRQIQDADGLRVACGSYSASNGVSPLSATTLITTVSGKLDYIVTCVLMVTAVGSAGTAQATIRWDGGAIGGCEQPTAVINLNGPNRSQIILPIHATVSTDITVEVATAGISGGAQYGIYATVVALN